MAMTLDQFTSEAHRILKAEPGPQGREQVGRLLEGLVKDEAFLAKHLPDGTGTREILYEDKELGFCVLAHAYEGASESNPHDHGPSWAIYAQARGETEMTEWELVEPASQDKAGKVKRAKTYTLKPGMAQVYNEGQLHSPKRAGATRLVRIEGTNMDHVSRLRYEAV
jgi:predicted metal-dependent enzyme (double-stranded beta helix superfamily)